MSMVFNLFKLWILDQSSNLFIFCFSRHRVGWGACNLELPGLFMVCIQWISPLSFNLISIFRVFSPLFLSLFLGISILQSNITAFSGPEFALFQIVSFASHFSFYLMFVIILSLLHFHFFEIHGENANSQDRYQL